MSLVFSSVYMELHELLMTESANFPVRQQNMACERVNSNLDIAMEGGSINFFSHPTHRVLPMRFLLAEMCHMLAGKNDIETMESYNSGMRKYSNDGTTLGASYGEKICKQLPVALGKLRTDPFTRQACCSIFQRYEGENAQLTHIPCNVFLQFLMRDEKLILIVTSRSSDFVTGFSIDTVHWQMLLAYMANSLDRQPGMLHYNIGSLHIYEKDMEVIKQWDVEKMKDTSYSHTIRVQKTLETVMADCAKHFTKDMKVSELCDLLGLTQLSMAICNFNQDVFVLYRNKLAR